MFVGAHFDSLRRSSCYFFCTAPRGVEYSWKIEYWLWVFVYFRRVYCSTYFTIAVYNLVHFGDWF